MPIYVYKFVDTGETIEVEQSFTDDTLTKYKHPDTGKTMAVRKVFQPVGVTFKGSGFYKTDSRANASSKSKSTTKDTETKSETNSEIKSDSSAKSAESTAAPKKDAPSTATKSDS